MKIKRLALKNFRNYELASFTFSDSTNVLIGKNAQGKTNLIEAIYLLSIAIINEILHLFFLLSL